MALNRRRWDGVDLHALGWPRPMAVAGGAVSLRPMETGDISAVSVYRAMPDVTRWLSHRPLTAEANRERCARRILRMMHGDDEPMLNLVVCEAGEVIGDCSLRLAPAAVSQSMTTSQWEGTLGYCLHPAVHGRGIATAVVRELVRIGLCDLGVRRITGIAYAENVGSVRAMERAGMRREAHFRRQVLTADGQWHDDIHLAILREEYAG